ncbi:MAG TPA: DDE-type integrase/transposase/recombinase [Tepidisphaeraceae bacterium]|nr:DDE-type integrase/transposase/recombinase [Tepidisphaeraceae bacterium]
MKLRRDEGDVRRLCREKLAAEGKAIIATSPVSGRPQWFVRRDFDPRLTADDGGRTGAIGLEQCSGRRRDEALQKWDCVRKYRAILNGREPMKTARPKLIASLRLQYPSLRISRSGLHTWHAEAASFADIDKLIDRRGGHQAPEASPECWPAMKDLYLHPNQPTVRHCWKIVRAMATKNGWKWISYGACRRQLNRRISPEEQALHRQPEKYRQELAPYIAQEPESWRAGELYISDHKQLDCWARWRGTIIRIWLTAWTDWRTRKIVGWTLSDSPCSSTILGSLGKAMRDPANCGGPAEVRVDNGKDFSAFVFHGSTKRERQLKISPRVDEGSTRGIFGMLGIEVHFARPHNPNGKSRLERFFGNLTSFARTFDTFCGIDSETKPERLAEILANPAAIPTFAEVEKRMANFIAGYNANADHAMDDLSEDGVKLSPNEAFARWCDTRRVMADPAALDLLLAHWHKPMTAGRNGLSLTISGRVLHYGHTDPSLRPFKAFRRQDRRVVNVSYDPDHLESVRVFDEQFRFVATVEMNHVGGVVEGLTKEDHATAHRKLAAYQKSMRHVAEYGITGTLTAEEQIAEAAFDRREQTSREIASANSPAKMRIVQTPLDGQSKEVRREEIREAIEPVNAAEAAARQVSPMDLLRRSTPPAARPAASKQLDGFALLRKRFA